MQKDHYAPGEPCWVDCGTDVTKAGPFYSALFGWQLNDLGEAAGGYTMALRNGQAVAGLGPSPQGNAPAWNVYIRVDDAERTKDKVLAAGGSVGIEPMEVMEAGFLAGFLDTAGASFCVWQPKDMAGFGEVNSAGTYCWAELITSDLAGAKEFYGDVFGWRASDSEDNAMPYTEFQLGVTSVAGAMPTPDAMPAGAPSAWGVYFAVDDADESLAKALELGATAMVGPIDVPVGRFATCLDPAGAAFSFIAMQPMA